MRNFFQHSFARADYSLQTGNTKSRQISLNYKKKQLSRGAVIFFGALLFILATGFNYLTAAQALPVAVNDAYSGLAARGQNAPGFLANDSDPTGGGFTFNTIVNYVQHGTLNFPDQAGTFGYAPSPGYVGNDSFTYRICNANGCSQATVTLNGANHAPNAVGESLYFARLPQSGCPRFAGK